jgi:hypothetical protein
MNRTFSLVFIAGVSAGDFDGGDLMLVITPTKVLLSTEFDTGI